MLRRSFNFASQTAIKTGFLKPLRCKDYGADVLQDPLWNKGLAFGIAERDRLGLRGLLPAATRTLEQQMARCITTCRAHKDPIEQSLYLQELQNRNETLYLALLAKYTAELAPLIYTPMVGRTCLSANENWRRPRGMYFSSQDVGHMGAMMYNWPQPDVHIVVVTDGSRILGLGDLGANGMPICIGKLALYSACGGIAPHRVFPVQLDVGTNNQDLLDNPNYLGMRHKRLEGDAYYDFVDEWIDAVSRRWPAATIQFEDFETPKALALLAKYRDKYRCFNDDIQGTGAVTVAGIMSAARIANVAFEDIRVVVAGGGSAGQGVATALSDAIFRNSEGKLTPEEARRRIVISDHLGTVGALTSGGPHEKVDASLGSWRNPQYRDGMPLHAVVKEHKPHVILGLTAHAGVFDEPLLKSMCDYQARPIVFPLSNPTSKAECTAEQAYKWTDGRAIVGTGSPFDPVTINGKKMYPSQCNNMYIFPPLGLAGSVGGIKYFSDAVFYAASKACAESLNAEEIALGMTFPAISRIQEVSRKIASAVLQQAYSEMQTTKITKHNVRMGLDELVERKFYRPVYSPLVPNLTQP